MSNIVNASVGSEGWEEVEGDDERQRKVLTESVCVEFWKPGAEVEVEVPEGGASVFVISGTYGTWDNDVYQSGTFIRYPEETTLVGAPCFVWVNVLQTLYFVAGHFAQTLIAGREAGAYVMIMLGHQNMKSKM